MASLNSVKIQTALPNAYRKTFHFLKDNNAQYYTRQLHEDNPFRVVVRNSHLLTPTDDIKSELENSVRQIINVLHKQTKANLPILYYTNNSQPST